MHKPESVQEYFIQENSTRFAKNFLRFWDTNGSLIPARRPDLEIISKKRKKNGRTYRQTDFAVTVDHFVKIKESEKKQTLPEN